MGLDISRMGTDKSWGWGYGKLHAIRWLAARSEGFEGGFNAFEKIEHTGKPKETWKMWPRYYQLMHFSDCEGVMVPAYFLGNVNHKKSFHIGNYDKFKEEITRLWGWVSSHKDEILRLDCASPYDIIAIENLFHMLTDDDGRDILLFH